METSLPQLQQKIPALPTEQSTSFQKVAGSKRNSCFPQLVQQEKEKSGHASDVQLERRERSHCYQLLLLVGHPRQRRELKTLEQQGEEQPEFLQRELVANAPVGAAHERLEGVEGDG